MDRILLAASDLGPDGQSFTAEELVVQAWRNSPHYFGLQGYADQYPDSNRVLTKIMGSQSPLRRRGLLRKVGKKRYQLTDAGLHAANSLGSAPRQTEQRVTEMTRRLVSSLQRMLESSALSKFARNQQLSFSDVCGFWNISPRSSAHQLAAKTSEADTAIEIAIQRAEAGGGRAVLPGDIVVEAAQLKLLQELSVHIRQEFAAELEVIEGRHDERRM